jgi:hypothetical protein
MVELGPEIPEQWFLPATITNGQRTVQIVGAWLKPHLTM